MKKISIPQGQETYILCSTAGRKEKEKAIRRRFSAHMEGALQRLGRMTWRARRAMLHGSAWLPGSAGSFVRSLTWSHDDG